jgi:hypothetical protein
MYLMFFLGGITGGNTLRAAGAVPNQCLRIGGYCLLDWTSDSPADQGPSKAQRRNFFSNISCVIFSKLSSGIMSGE